MMLNPTSRHFLTTTITCLRCFHITAGLKRTPRVMPVTHQVLGDHNAQYFTSYPNLTREEMEEPPPRVSEEVRDLLQKSRIRLIGQDGVRFPEIAPHKFRRMRKELIKAGHYFPVFPMRDRMLDIMPKVKKHVLAKEQRLIRIKENMKMMPVWIAEYKAKISAKKLAKKEAAEEQKFNRLYMEKLGLHPKDPRSKDILAKHTSMPGDHSEKKEKKKKKFGAKKVKKL